MFAGFKKEFNNRMSKVSSILVSPNQLRLLSATSKNWNLNSSIPLFNAWQFLLEKLKNELAH